MKWLQFIEEEEEEEYSLLFKSRIIKLVMTKSKEWHESNY